MKLESKILITHHKFATGMSKHSEFCQLFQFLITTLRLFPLLTEITLLVFKLIMKIKRWLKLTSPPC